MPFKPKKNMTNKQKKKQRSSTRPHRSEERREEMKVSKRRPRDWSSDVCSSDLGSAIFVTAGKWHNIINTGHQPIKLYTIYAPPEPALGTIHLTKADAIQAEKEHD